MNDMQGVLCHRQKSTRRPANTRQHAGFYECTAVVRAAAEIERFPGGISASVPTDRRRIPLEIHDADPVR